MKRGLVACLLVIGLAFTTYAAAYIVHFNPAGNATGISFLIVDHSSYDVTFEYGVYEDFYPGLQSPFCCDYSEPILAVQAIAAALNDSSANTAGGASDYLGVPGIFFPRTPGAPPGFVGFIEGVLVAGPGTSFNTWARGPFFVEDIGVGLSSPIEWVVFERVPEPASFALIAIGLASIATVRRRRRTA